MTKKRYKFGELIATNLEFPYEGVVNVPVIELKGREEAHVNGCRSIIEYDQDLVIFDTGSYKIKITGSKLTLTEFLSGNVCVLGTISDISIG